MATTNSLFRKTVKAVTPLSLRMAVREAWAGRRMRPVKKAMYFGLSRYCPVCKAHIRSFRPFRPAPDPLACCPVCQSQGRHRMFWLWLPEHTNILDGRPKKLLHVAPNGPERDLGMFLQSIPSIDYVSGDLENPIAMVKLDITKIQFAEATFDIILCSHVLEHVPEDRKAMTELFRVLKPGGWALLQVPIAGETTFEDPTVIDPKERERLFRQWDHVRQYGEDFKDRLESVGFEIEIIPGAKAFSAKDIERSELISDEDRGIWLCKKPARNGNGHG